MHKMKSMGRPWRMGDLEIKNRLVRSATSEGLSTAEGAPTPGLIKVLTALAKGGVGLIIAGSAYISREGRWGKNGTGLDDDRLVEPLSRLAGAVNDAGGLPAAQLLHCGSNIDPDLVSERKALYGPSAMTDPVCNHPVEELSIDRIRGIVDAYAKAALRAKKAGFRAVQIHAAHGYLINQFLSPSRNRRHDSYGGSPARRALLLYQVTEAVRGAVGGHFPVFVKMSAHDGFPGGVQPQEAVRVAATLNGMGIDALEVSAGTPEGAKKGGWDHILPAPFKEGSLLKYALQIKAKVRCPVISVEGWRNPSAIIDALGKIDAVSMSRPFIREPDLARRWLDGDPSPAKCISCNRCLALTETSGLGCVFHKQPQGLTDR